MLQHLSHLLADEVYGLQRANHHLELHDLPGGIAAELLIYAEILTVPLIERIAREKILLES